MTITSKEEFVTAYTPYQAEISQGVLQSIFEYQTEMCQLTGMDVSNASVYDGAVAAAEAVFMCQERKKQGVIVSGAVDPKVLAVIKTYCASRSVEVKVLPVADYATDIEALKSALDKTSACVYVQSPNYYGVIEDMEAVVVNIVYDADSYDYQHIFGLFMQQPQRQWRIGTYLHPLSQNLPLLPLYI